MAQRKVSCEVYTDRGIVGPKGDDGTPNSLSIGTVEGGETAAATITGDAPNQTLNLVLPKGDKGDAGQDGADGRDGADGQDGADGNGISSITKTGTSGLVDTYTITMTDGNSTTFDVTNGKDGEDGQDGQDGRDGTDGTDGQDGFSPSATVSKSGSVTTLTVTDKDGTTTATINDGEVSTADLNAALALKQDTLVSGTNIKTVNNNSLLGSGNLDIDALPSQTGQSGKFLTTNGTAASWANVDALPSQTGQSGKFLTTDGSDASWADIPTEVDNKSVTLNSSDQIQTVGVIDQNNTSNAIKTWTGTKAEYDAIVTKDPNTTYRTIDETDSSTNYTTTELSAMGMPSSRYDNITLGSSGASYTAPGNGYYYMYIPAGSNANTQLIYMENVGKPCVSSTAPGNVTGIACTLPVLSGDTIKIYYVRQGSSSTLRFYYAQGNPGGN